MTDRPILFSAPMVRALIEGRKTQTRRLVKPQPTFDAAGAHNANMGGRNEWWDYWSPEHPSQRFRLRYAKGDRLWVRETFSGPADYSLLPPRDWSNGEPIWYWAAGNPTEGDWTKPKPGIHMPRRASRLTLMVTDVRVERLQAIKLHEIMAEGIDAKALTVGGPSMREMFEALWNGINGAGAWAANPWVVALTFTVEHRNIDA